MERQFQADRRELSDADIVAAESRHHAAVFHVRSHADEMAASADQRRELDRIDGLEPRPPPDFILPYLDAPIWSPVDPRRFAPAFARMEALVRTATALDHNLDDPANTTVDSELPLAPFGPSFDITPDSVIYAASAVGLDGGVDPRIIPPTSIRAAQSRPDYSAPFGWKAAIQKEIDRVVAFKAFRVVPISQYFKDRKRYGDSRVSVGYSKNEMHCFKGINNLT